MLNKEQWDGPTLSNNSVTAFLEFLQEAIDDFRRPHMHFNYWRWSLGSAVGMIEQLNAEVYDDCRSDWFQIRDFIYKHKHKVDDNLYFEELSEYLTEQFKKKTAGDPFCKRLATWQRLATELAKALQIYPNPAWENWIVWMYLDGVHWEQEEKIGLFAEGYKSRNYIDPDSESISWQQLAGLLEGGKERE